MRTSLALLGLASGTSPPVLGLGDGGHRFQRGGGDVNFGDVAVTSIPSDACVQHAAFAIKKTPRHLRDWGEPNGIFSMSHRGKSAGITVMRCRTAAARAKFIEHCGEHLLLLGGVLGQGVENLGET